MGSARDGSVSTVPTSRRIPFLGVLAGLSLLAVETTAVAQTSAPAAAPIWTQVPTRIDRSKDTRQRVEQPAPPPGFVLRDVRTDADGRLIVADRRYRLFGLAPIAPNRICVLADGRRWACGIRARAFLSGQVVGATLRCFDAGDPTAPEPVVDCRVRERSLSELVVASGFAELDAEGAATPTLATALAAARRAGLGVWATSPPP